MSLPRFFLDNQVLADEVQAVFPLRLSSGDLHHAHVLRIKPGEHLVVIDAASDYFECECVSFDEDLLVRICTHRTAREEAPQVILLQGLCKGDKFDEVVRHGCEIGIGAFVPLACERSVVKLDREKARQRTSRWRAIARSAAMQAGLDKVPAVSEPVSIEDAAAELACATCVLVCWEEEHATSIPLALSRALSSTATSRGDGRIAVVVGPEGGLTGEEVERLLSCNQHSFSVTLGPTILRTETAGLVAPALCLYELGGLQ